MRPAPSLPQLATAVCQLSLQTLSNRHSYAPKRLTSTTLNITAILYVLAFHVVPIASDELRPEGCCHRWWRDCE